MNTLKKLILVRKNDSQADMFENAPFANFIVGEPLPICPLCDTAWPLQAGITHYGFIVEGLKLKDFVALTDYNNDPETLPFLTLDWLTQVTDRKTMKVIKYKDSSNVLENEQLDATLGQVGLSLNELAIEVLTQ